MCAKTELLAKIKFLKYVLQQKVNDIDLLIPSVLLRFFLVGCNIIPCDQQSITGLLSSFWKTIFVN
jgi:hypothetical protein